MNFTWKLAVFVLIIIYKVSGSYEPWEKIKEWYSDFEYDRKQAEIRHAKLEKNCLEIHNKTEEVCFDECMLRTGYNLLIFSRIKGGDLLYGGNSERGLEHLRKKVLNLTAYALSTHEQHVHAVFKNHLERCLELKASFILPHKVGKIYERNHEKGLRKICSEMLNEEEMGHIRDYVNCFKEQIRNVWIEPPVVTSTSKPTTSTTKRVRRFLTLEDIKRLKIDTSY
ncbi:unnamed protein product [Orchesella dallaii]|uniref:Uncharacterized protein n=1 Tax=Orchesella dallaii TaxID=48710 RepID=A0ABP1RP64_9HEXA